jgi:hypothetical protein
MRAQQISACLGYQNPNQEAQAEYQAYDMQQSTSIVDGNYTMFLHHQNHQQNTLSRRK